MKFLKCILFLSVILPAVTVNADIYAGLSASRVNVDGGDVDSASGNNFGLSLGKSINPYFAVEGRFYLSSSGMDVDGNGVDYSVKLKNAIGLAMRASTDSTKSVYGYALLGFSQAKVEVDVTDVVIIAPPCAGCPSPSIVADSTSETDSGASFGLGVGVNIGENFDLGIENYFLTSDVDLLSLTLNYTF